MRPYDSAFDEYDIRTARSNGQAVLDVINGEGDGEQLDTSTRKALQLAQENLNSAAMEALKDLTLAQIDSLKQREAKIDEPTLEDITRRKGGNTALLFALEVNPDMTARKRKAYQELGVLFQLTDDFEDATKDKAEGIITLATISGDNTRLIARIKKQYKLVLRLFTQNYEAYQLVDFRNYLDKLVAGVGFLRN